MCRFKPRFTVFAIDLGASYSFECRALRRTLLKKITTISFPVSGDHSNFTSLSFHQPLSLLVFGSKPNHPAFSFFFPLPHHLNRV
jgi:hypothetical protein